MQQPFRTYPTTEHRQAPHTFRLQQNATMVQSPEDDEWCHIIDRNVADKIVKVPEMAESISEGTLKQWSKRELTLTVQWSWSKLRVTWLRRLQKLAILWNKMKR